MPLPTIDLSGQRFGRLLAISHLGMRKQGKSKSASSLWLCKCDCGKQRKVFAYSLRRGDTKSCGCLARETASKLCAELGRRGAKNGGVLAERQLYCRYQNDARRRALPFDISYESAGRLFRGHCSYCGIEPYKMNYIKKQNSVFIYNGIDRVDNKLGYIDGNVVSCCAKCNDVKRRMEMPEFVSYITMLYRTTVEHANIRL